MMPLIILLFSVTMVFCCSSQGINYDALKKCTDHGGDGMMCDGDCFHGVHWCNDLTPQYCPDSGMMTNDLELCADDERWKDISCNWEWRGQEYLGERCTDCVNGTRNYCLYPEGLRENLDNLTNLDYNDYYDHDYETLLTIMTMKNLPTTCDCVSSQNINYDALVPCSDEFDGNAGMMCGELCLPSYYWCNDKYRMRCPDSGVMTNDPDLCSQDERWSKITCDFDLGSKGQYPGERCTINCTTGTRNYCYYPQGTPVDVNYLKPDFFFTTCDCDSNDSADSVTIALVAILLVLVILAAAAVGGGFYYYNYKKKQLQGPSHEAPVEATQESEM